MSTFHSQNHVHMRNIERQLKWEQLKELHAAIKLCSTTLVQEARTNFSVRSTTRGAANGSSNVMYFTMAIPIELNDGMKVLVSNKTMEWNQYSKINSFLQQSKNSN
ncbi:hypothetical protein CFP56_008747 [Quercus suber]|uniref:Uncharacterized protein n=1 Tax=Quercus suber TaxID=58331 RepID=A0AAW0M885_QUESU